MKNIVTIILLIGLFSSCKKNDDLVPASELKSKHQLSFVTGGFKQQTSDFKSASGKTSDNAAVSGYANFLYYYVFSSDGTFLHAKTQTADSLNFGVIQDQLPSGNYKIVFIASEFRIYTFLGTENFSTFKMILPVEGGDTFSKQLDISISEGSSHSVQLERIIGAIDVIIEDEFPAEASQLGLSIQNDAGLYNLSNQLPEDFSIYNTRTAYYPLVSKAANQKFSILAFNTSTKMTVTITCTDKVQNLLAYKNINEIGCAKNKRTLLSGKLFAIEGGFDLSLNSVWVNANLVSIN